VSSAAQVNELLTFADGVIVGSYLMGKIMNAQDPAMTAHDTIQGLLNGK